MPNTQNDATKQRDDKCVPMARQVIKIIASHADELPLGAMVNDQERLRVFSKIYQEVAEYFITVNPKLNEIKFIFRLVDQGMSLTKDIFERSMETNKSVAERILWKLHNLEDLAIMDIDAVIKGNPIPDHSADAPKVEEPIPAVEATPEDPNPTATPSTPVVEDPAVDPAVNNTVGDAPVVAEPVAETPAVQA